MTTKHTFKVIGDPVAQGRPRFARVGKFVRAYDPDKSRAWKADIKAQVLQQLGGRPEIHEGPLEIIMVFFMRRPKSLANGVAYHIKRPDADNLAKAVKDALSSVLYRDDSQIVSLIVRKEYADGATGVMVMLEEVA